MTPHETALNEVCAKYETTYVRRAHIEKHVLAYLSTLITDERVDEAAFEAFMLAVHEYGPTGLGYRKALAAYEAARTATLKTSDIPATVDVTSKGYGESGSTRAPSNPTSNSDGAFQYKGTGEITASNPCTKSLWSDQQVQDEQWGVSIQVPITTTGPRRFHIETHDGVFGPFTEGTPGREADVVESETLIRKMGFAMREWWETKPISEGGIRYPLMGFEYEGMAEAVLASYEAAMPCGVEAIEEELLKHPRYLHNPLTGNERKLIEDVLFLVRRISPPRESREGE